MRIRNLRGGLYRWVKGDPILSNMSVEEARHYQSLAGQKGAITRRINNGAPFLTGADDEEISKRDPRDKGKRIKRR